MRGGWSGGKEAKDGLGVRNSGDEVERKWAYEEVRQEERNKEMS